MSDENADQMAQSLVVLGVLALVTLVWAIYNWFGVEILECKPRSLTFSRRIFSIELKRRRFIASEIETIHAMRSPFGRDTYRIASVGGCEDSVTVERKTLEDFVSTVTRSRKRFTRELRRLSGYDAACVVVEADLRDILGGRYRSGTHPNAVLGTLLSIVVYFGIPVFFCSDRQAACRFVEGFLHRYRWKKWV